MFFLHQDAISNFIMHQVECFNKKELAHICALIIIRVQFRYKEGERGLLLLLNLVDNDDDAAALSGK